MGSVSCSVVLVLLLHWEPAFFDFGSSNRSRPIAERNLLAALATVLGLVAALRERDQSFLLRMAARCSLVLGLLVSLAWLGSHAFSQLQ